MDGRSHGWDVKWLVISIIDTQVAKTDGWMDGWMR